MINNNKVQFFLSYPVVPGEEAVDGIRFDFCDGCRVLFPNGNCGHTVILTDLDTMNVLQNTYVCAGGKFRSEIRYFVNWKLDIYDAFGELIFTHSLDLHDREVLFIINSDAIGDTIAWFPYIDKFQKKYSCRAGVIMNKRLRTLFEDNYPDIAFFNRGDEKILAPYASFLLGINYKCEQKIQKESYFNIPLHHVAGYDLGFERDIEINPPVVSDAGYWDMGKPFVCLSIKGSHDYKNWNNPKAIDNTVAWLNSKGYRVLLVDKEYDSLHGAENFTGDVSLRERVSLFKHCKAFIGMSSGLSWLAWASGAKVILLSGFTSFWNEFKTPYRVGNLNKCHSCWNNPKRFLSCIGKDNEYECSKEITDIMVIKQLQIALGE